RPLLHAGLTPSRDAGLCAYFVVPRAASLFHYTTLFRSRAADIQLQQSLRRLPRVRGARHPRGLRSGARHPRCELVAVRRGDCSRSEAHTSELQSREKLVCHLLLEKKNYTGRYLDESIKA